jgi:hypothetical protein
MRAKRIALQASRDRSGRGFNLAFSVGLAYKSEPSLMLKY